MFKNKFGARNNIAGINVRKLRIEKKGWSQKYLADRLQEYGHDIGKNAVQQMESGARFITDIELKVLAQVLDTSVESLLEISETEHPKVRYDNSDNFVLSVAERPE